MGAHPSGSERTETLIVRTGLFGTRDVFIIQFREPSKAAIGPRAERVQSDGGHVVVRVAPGGATYRVFVLDDLAETFEVESVHGPYGSQ